MGLLEVIATLTNSNFVLISLFSIFAFLFILSQKSNGKNAPPGPTGLPFVGYLPFMTLEPHVKFMKLAKTYGNVFRLKLGSREAVILNDFKSIKEAAAKDEVLDRPPHSTFDFFDALFPNVINANGLQWKEQRRFMLHSLRDMGIGKKDMETFIQEIFSDITQYINDKKGEPCNIGELGSTIASNIILIKVFGKKFNVEDKQGRLLNNHLEYCISKFGQAGITTFLPSFGEFLKKMDLFEFGKMYRIQRELGGHLGEMVKEHTESFDPEDIRDYVDMYLKEKSSREKEGDHLFDVKFLEGNVFALFAGGTETATTSMQWLLLLMAGNPRIQDKIYCEIIDKVGSERLPSLADQKNMPFITAVIMEQQRWATVVPLGVYRHTTKDTTIQGYSVKKDTVVFFNIHAMHHDPTYWKNPDDFIPERFLSEKGELLPKLDSFAPFSLGKRACPGEILAHAELFLLFSAFIQKYKITVPEGKTVDYSPYVGMCATRYPKMKMLCLNLR